MIHLKHSLVTATAAALCCLLGPACTGSTSSSEPTPDLSSKAKVVTFDVSGMT